MMKTDEWLLLLPQTPSSPSSVRVMVWRRMQQAGAVNLQNGVWMLPACPAHETVFQELLHTLEEQGGSGSLFRASACGSSFHDQVIRRFHTEREQEYVEFSERCQALLHELEKETAVEKFTFAELEENEQDLQKLTSWLRKVQRRDFFPGQAYQEAESLLGSCRQALQAFTTTVYARAGLKLPEPSRVVGEGEHDGVQESDQSCEESEHASMSEGGS